MLALVRYGYNENDIEMRNIPEPSPAYGEVKIEVKAVGICGTDLIGRPGLQLPVVIGHELSGDRVEVGEGVRTRKIGDRVTCDTTAYICRECRFCLAGDYNLCIERRSIASRANGAFAKYMVIREGSASLLPDNVSYSSGSICELLACAVHFVTEQALI